MCCTQYVVMYKMATKILVCISLLAYARYAESQLEPFYVKDGIVDMASWVPVNPDLGYAPGSCGVHVIHYQIPDGPNNFYSIEATIKDANGDFQYKLNELGIPDAAKIGEIPRTQATGPINISSKLPYQLIVTTALPGSVPDTDAEPVNFAYGGDFWNSGDQTRCSQGGYENGARHMDCGFAC